MTYNMVSDRILLESVQAKPKFRHFGFVLNIGFGLQQIWEIFFCDTFNLKNTVRKKLNSLTKMIQS